MDPFELQNCFICLVWGSVGKLRVPVAMERVQGSFPQDGLKEDAG